MELLGEIDEGALGIDTCIFIYFIEDHVRYGAPIKQVFANIDNGSLVAYTSVVTLLELLIKPLQNNNLRLAQQYEDLLTSSTGLTLVDLDRDIVKGAARLRAALGLATPDALQLAAAFAVGCTTFLTNDRSMKDLPGMRILQLSTFV